MQIYRMCCIKSIEGVLLIHFCACLITALPGEYSGSATVGVSLCYLNTMLLCFSAQKSEPNKFWGRRLFVIHRLCQVLMACCASWVENQREKSARKRKHKMRISYLKKCFNTSNCKEKEQEWGWQEGEREEEEGTREEKKRDEIRLPYGCSCRTTTFQHTSWECVRGRAGEISERCKKWFHFIRMPVVLWSAMSLATSLATMYWAEQAQWNIILPDMDSNVYNAIHILLHI